MHINTRDICKNGKCPLCDETVNELSEENGKLRWECTSCDKIWKRRVPEVPT